MRCALCSREWEKLDDVTVPDLMEFIKGPDFPTGGMLFTQRDGVDGICWRRRTVPGAAR